MQSVVNLLKKYRVLTGLFVVLIVVYIGQTLTAVPSQDALDKYHVSVGQLHLLSLTIAIPYIVIWIFGLLGYLRLKMYAKALEGSEDGRAWLEISYGVLLLVLWLPLNVLLSNVFAGYYGHHPAATISLVRINNYTNIILLAPAFYMVYRGSRNLLKVAKLKEHGLSERWTAVFIVFSVLYVFLVLSDAVRQHPNDTAGVATYYLPDWATLLTIVVPRLLTWYLGLAAAANLILYRQKVKGSIYKEGLTFIAYGLAGVVAAIVALRAVQSLSAFLGGWSLGLLLLLVYGLLVLLAIGYVLVAKGAKRLIKIEEL